MSSTSRIETAMRIEHISHFLSTLGCCLSLIHYINYLLLELSNPIAYYANLILMHLLESAGLPAARCPQRRLAMPDASYTILILLKILFYAAIYGSTMVLTTSIL